jgi:hypothetical protein
MTVALPGKGPVALPSSELLAMITRLARVNGIVVPVAGGDALED